MLIAPSRLSRGQLAAIRTRLLDEREHLVRLIQGETGDRGGLAETKRNEFGSPADGAVLIEEQDELAAETEELETDLRAVRSALQSLEDGCYGKCKNCGRPIPVKRLLALPTALRDVTCERLHERSSR